MDLEDFRHQLVRQLPSNIPLYQVQEIDLSSPAANQSMVAAEYLLTISTSELIDAQIWQNWIESILARREILSEHRTKSGKQQIINLRDRLFELSLVKLENSSVESEAIVRYLCVNQF